jgi:hypothetical protein
MRDMLACFARMSVAFSAIAMTASESDAGTEKGARFTLDRTDFPGASLNIL